LQVDPGPTKNNSVSKEKTNSLQQEKGYNVGSLALAHDKENRAGALALARDNENRAGSLELVHDKKASRHNKVSLRHGSGYGDPCLQADPV
jgi:hypothetical protein